MVLLVLSFLPQNWGHNAKGLCPVVPAVSYVSCCIDIAVAILIIVRLWG